MRRRVGAAGAVVLAVAVLAISACTPLPPPPPPPPPAPVVRRAPPPLDWFQRQLAQARAARRTHQPASDRAGAEQAYDSVVRAACERVSIEGPDKYKPRCDAMLKPPANVPTAAPQDPFACDASSDDETLRACND